MSDNKQHGRRGRVKSDYTGMSEFDRSFLTGSLQRRRMIFNLIAVVGILVLAGLSYYIFVLDRTLQNSVIMATIAGLAVVVTGWFSYADTMRIKKLFNIEEASNKEFFSTLKELSKNDANDVVSIEICDGCNRPLKKYDYIAIENRQ